MMMFSIPDATHSSTTYLISRLSTTGSISLGCALVAGRNRVPSPAAGSTALRTRFGFSAICSTAPSHLTCRSHTCQSIRCPRCGGSPSLRALRSPIHAAGKVNSNRLLVAQALLPVRVLLPLPSKHSQQWLCYSTLSAAFIHAAEFDLVLCCYGRMTAHLVLSLPPLGRALDGF